MADYVEVIDAGPGWTRVRDAEGNEFTLKGARNWRNNNPGNIEFGPFAQAAGAVGSDGRFAVFPSYEQGRAAKEQLIFSSPSYRDLTLEQAISRYAPPSENNTSAYLNAVTRAANVSKDTRMGQMDPATRQAVLDAMQKVEGFQVGRTLNAQGIPLPPAEIPNVVATLTDTVPPVAPVPETLTPDMRLMRNPVMSLSAREAQVTPMRDVPLPRPRPPSVDSIISDTMASLRPPVPRTNATRAADLDLTRQNSVTPRLTAQGDNAYTYWIPDVTQASLVGGRGSLTPSVGATPSAAPFPATQSPHLAALRARDQDLQTILNARYPTRLPELPLSNIGKPPTTRVVQSVPVKVTPPAATVPTVRPPVSGGSSGANIQQQRQEQMALRTPQRMSDIGDPIQFGDIDMMFNWTPQPAGSVNYWKGNERLPRGVPGLPQTPMQVAAGPLPQFNVVPAPPAAARVVAPMPMPAAMRPLAPMRPPSPLPIAANTASPLRIVVNGGNYVKPRPPMLTPTQALQATGISPASAYALANAKAAQQARENASRPEHLSVDSWFNEVTGRA